MRYIYHITLILSLAAHLSFAYCLVTVLPKWQHVKPPEAVTVKIEKKEKPKEEPKIEVAEVPPPPPPPPEPPKALTERKPKKEVVEPPKPVQGLSPTALSKDGKGIAAPIGNTMLASDEGKREKEVGELADMSSDAKLIPNSVTKPKYTDEAIEANIEGLVVVDVYVDERGNVTQAELRKKPGYGMDARIVASAKNARFEPRKDRFGRAVAGWTDMKFRLEIPN